MPRRPETFGERLGELIEQRGLKQTQAARQLKCSSGFLSDVVNNLKRPGLDFLERVAEEFEVSLDWLVLGRSTPHSPHPVDLNHHRLVVGAIEVVRAALLENDPGALATLEDLLSPAAKRDLLTQERVESLQHWSNRAETALLAIGVHNTFLQQPGLAARVHGALSTALALFQTRRLAPDIPEGGPSADRAHSRARAEKEMYPRLIMNVGNSIRSAGRDYYEHTYTKGKRPAGDD